MGSGATRVHAVRRRDILGTGGGGCSRLTFLRDGHGKAMAGLFGFWPVWQRWVSHEAHGHGGLIR